jgi:hypothetical protein
MSYRYVLRVSAGEIPSLSHEQLVQLCLEQYWLLVAILAIVRNAQAELATRVIMIDYLIETVQRCVRKSIKDVTERMPVLYSGEVREKGTGKRIQTGKTGIAERIGVHANTVSTVYSKMEASGLIKKDYRTDEGSHQKHIDVWMQPAFLLHPVIEDRKGDEGKKERKPKDKPVCPTCGSSNCDLHHVTVCHDCNAITDVLQTGETPLDEQLPHDEMVVESVLSPVEEVSPTNKESLGKETPVILPHDEMVVDEAEQIVRLTEDKRGTLYSPTARPKQLEAARGIVSLLITPEQYLTAYEERNDDWWQQRNGPLNVTDLWKMEDSSGEHRIVQVLARLKSKEHIRSRAVRKQGSEPPVRTVWWNGREVPEEQAYQEGYEGGFERFKKSDHPDDDLAALAKRLQAEGILPTYPTGDES